jgi:hypothetical protein
MYRHILLPYRLFLICAIKHLKMTGEFVQLPPIRNQLKLAISFYSVRIQHSVFVINLHNVISTFISDIKRWNTLLYVLGRRLSGVSRKLQYWIELYIGLHYDCCMLTGLERWQWKDYCVYEQRLPRCGTEEAAPWMSQQLGLLVFHIAGMVLGIALCWCWQCLLTVGGNMLPYIVTLLDVTTVAWCCRQTKDVLHPVEFLPAALKTSEWQWTVCVFTVWWCIGSSCSLFSKFDVYIIIWLRVLTVGQAQPTSVPDDTVHHVRSVQFHASPCCISQWFIVNVCYLYWL